MYGSDEAYRMDARLIFDIGANKGQDSAYYLDKGFRVVAVDADPDLCAFIREREAARIAAGLLTVMNTGVAGSHGLLDFYVNDFSEWSSLTKESKATRTNQHRSIKVPVVPLRSLLEAHGTPYYLKIDIEGAELDAIASMQGHPDMPPYLSFEVNLDWQAILDLLMGYGYDAFQLVRQGAGILPPPPVPPREGNAVEVAFTNAHSGCFGRDLPGSWLDAAGIRAAYATESEAAKARIEAGGEWGWHDIHARHPGHAAVG
jgi:FkbM family methyltransferase